MIHYFNWPKTVIFWTLSPKEEEEQQQIQQQQLLGAITCTDAAGKNFR